MTWDVDDALNDAVDVIVDGLLVAQAEEGVTLTEMDRRAGIGTHETSRLLNDPDRPPTIRKLVRIAHGLGRRVVVTFPKEEGSEG